MGMAVSVKGIMPVSNIDNDVVAGQINGFFEG